MLTILEVLENADYNLQNNKIPMQVDIAKEQLHNALNLLNQDMDLYDDFDESKLKMEYTIKVGEVFTQQKADELIEYLKAIESKSEVGSAQGKVSMDKVLNKAERKSQTMKPDNSRPAMQHNICSNENKCRLPENHSGECSSSECSCGYGFAYHKCPLTN